MPSLSIDEILSFSDIHTDIFVETGTYMGDTVNAVLTKYNKIISIELDNKYYTNAINRFINDTNVNIINGDSSIVLNNICPLLDKPVFFWLDGHWSSGDTGRGNKDCPLIEELECIVNKCKVQCVIAIDDARLFGTHKNEDWSYITENKVKNIINNRMASYKYFPSVHHPQDRIIITLSPIN